LDSRLATESEGLPVAKRVLETLQPDVLIY
jgi:hypothetical protein